MYLLDGSVQSSHREIEDQILITDFSNIPEEDGVRVHRQVTHTHTHLDAHRCTVWGCGSF